LLAAEGADAVAFPCLDFVPAVPEQRAALDRALTEIDRYCGVIVSSPNGADALRDALARLELDTRCLAGKLLAAIGTGTAERLREHGLRADIVPRHARAEGLVDALREREQLGGAWLQIRADEGRELLGRAVAKAGGRLELVVGYQTIRPAVSPLLLDSLRPIDAGGEGYDAICFASGRTARHFLETTGEAFGQATALEWLQRAKVIAIGPVTADAITELGIRVDAVAAEQSEAGLLAAVLATLSRARA
jgi:uroporphyrinogen III methyltransferase/synthase